MTDETTQVVPIRPSSPLQPSEAKALAGELAKCLKLVAPASMAAEHQTVWLHAAVDALQDIRANEVADVSAEIRRTATRPAQIVPMIAELVAKKRSRATSSIGRRPCRCGEGFNLTERTDVHCIQRNGETAVEFCTPSQRDDVA